jgi:hypothetical protein
MAGSANRAFESGPKSTACAGSAPTNGITVALAAASSLQRRQATGLPSTIGSSLNSKCAEGGMALTTRAPDAKRETISPPEVIVPTSRLVWSALDPAWRNAKLMKIAVIGASSGFRGHGQPYLRGWEARDVRRR